MHVSRLIRRSLEQLRIAMDVPAGSAGDAVPPARPVPAMAAAA
jgi:hypothetical protein